MRLKKAAALTLVTAMTASMAAAHPQLIPRRQIPQRQERARRRKKKRELPMGRRP